MKYRLIALDVDGTLLNDDYELTAVTKQTLRQLQEAGVKIVLCTGRGPANAVPILEQLEMEGVLITHNGAATIETPGPKLLHQYSFTVDEVTAIVRHCREHQVHFDVCTALDMYVETVGEQEAKMYNKYMVSPEIVTDVLTMSEPIVKLTMFGSEQQMDEAERELARLTLPESLTWIRSGVYFIDVMSKAVSKGNALRALARQWQIEPEAIVAMGNYYNDVDMIRFAGLGIAMMNSPEEVKQAADFVTASNNEDGVHLALLKHVMSN
ncbi:HAD family phosphatase [Paenibacillus cremeus]|uniref:HAD family phosphatase n=1 Tax=Paenibacillus cremeus TaxID=2163881 RepID=A0A559K858_9BACL|nr:HAD family phosphatase [Paenibacillus cremeus]